MSFVFVLASSSSSAAAVAARGCWTMPVSGVVVDGFREPACRWCAGNRGLEFSTDVGSPVRSAVAGSVSFSGSVA
ncbi:MAG: M23 family peptidase, partial [Actinomycetota bacterium]|nr:M23 family peptidase [Actinomycetota bacterium]